jgi:hypothetical protein
VKKPKDDTGKQTFVYDTGDNKRRMLMPASGCVNIMYDRDREPVLARTESGCQTYSYDSPGRFTIPYDPGPLRPTKESTHFEREGAGRLEAQVSVRILPVSRRASIPTARSDRWQRDLRTVFEALNGEGRDKLEASLRELYLAVSAWNRPSLGDS